MKKLLSAVLALVLVLSLACSASACTEIFVGSALTDNGNTFFARCEDMANSMNKLFSVIPAGVHKAGETYEGCYGFSYVFTKDSYGYTAFCDDVYEGICPDCGGEHVHTPYQAGGTNDAGLSVSATESLYCKQEYDEIDVYPENGIEEAEIVTVLLSECATAKEALDMLTGFYDEIGAQGGSGIVLADKNEVWYIENTTAKEYVAIKLPDDLVFVEPNQCVIGLVDLDDTENVVASTNVIGFAKEAGCFVGNEEENQINFCASYNGYEGERMVNGINFLNAEYNFTMDDLNADLYTVTNLDADGNIVALHNGLKLDKPFSAADVVNFFKVDAIGKPANLETHLFEITEDGLVTEWISMNDNQYSVFVPYFPQMTLDVYEGYKVSTAPVSYSEEAVETGFAYPTTMRTWTADGPVTVDAFAVLPEGWEDSYYWVFDALSNYILSVDDSEAETVKAELAALQDTFYAVYADMLKGVEEGTMTNEDVTKASMEMAQQAHDKALELLNQIKK